MPQIDNSALSQLSLFGGQFTQGLARNNPISYPPVPLGQGIWLNPQGTVPNYGNPPIPLFGAGSNANAARIGFAAADLGIPIVLQENTYLMGGDSFTGEGALQGQYAGSPTLARLLPDNLIDNNFHTPPVPHINDPRFAGLVNKPGYPTRRPERFLPGGIIQANGHNYVMLIPAAGQEPTAPGIIFRLDDPYHWELIGSTPYGVDQMGGYTDETGMTYIITSNLDRHAIPRLVTIRATEIENTSAWAPQLIGGVMNVPIGELDMKKIGETTVVTFANADVITAFIAPNPTRLAYARRTDIHMPGNMRNLYAPYIFPNSTLNAINLEVSNWNGHKGLYPPETYGTARAIIHPFT